MGKIPRVIAFYLPQYHPIPENDAWWGRGFTEWTNAAKARPLFKGHYQPRLPADLGFYDLRLPESRIAQAEMAKEYGVEAFCYYHYWFAGKRLLQRPYEEMLSSRQPDYPFCLCWANATWSGIWHGNPDRILIEQTYPGRKDCEMHFRELLKAFQDDRYLTIEGKPLFMIFRPKDVPSIREFADHMREMAEKAGLPGIYLVGVSHYDSWAPESSGFDAVVMQRIPALDQSISWRHPILKLKSRLHGYKLTVHAYKDVINEFVPEVTSSLGYHPCVIPSWDNTPRSNMNGLVLHGSTPELFRDHLNDAIKITSGKPYEHRLIFLKSWNEWAEGNYMEPDMCHGHKYLEALRDELNKS